MATRGARRGGSREREVSDGTPRRPDQPNNILSNIPSRLPPKQPPTHPAHPPTTRPTQQSIQGAFDPDQSRTEDALADEALTNKGESREALAFLARLVGVPLLAGALAASALAEPILSFTLANNTDAFAMTSRQKVEGAERVHQEEARVRMLMAIGQAPPLDEVGMARHLREFARAFEAEARGRNEAGLVTLVRDGVSLMVAAALCAWDAEGREALATTVRRLFVGLSDIAKAILIILVADTSLGYHSEEGWTALTDLVLSHYGLEAEQRSIVLFVGIIPIAIDVAFKWWARALCVAMRASFSCASFLCAAEECGRGQRRAYIPRACFLAQHHRHPPALAPFPQHPLSTSSTGGSSRGSTASRPPPWSRSRRWTGTDVSLLDERRGSTCGTQPPDRRARSAGRAECKEPTSARPLCIALV